MCDHALVLSTLSESCADDAVLNKAEARRHLRLAQKLGQALVDERAERAKVVAGLREENADLRRQLEAMPTGVSGFFATLFSAEPVRVIVEDHVELAARSRASCRLGGNLAAQASLSRSTSTTSVASLSSILARSTASSMTSVGSRDSGHK
jgi:hypothetical protein